MAEDIKCVCGGPGVGEGGKKRVLFPCSGASNTGQMSNHAAVRLAQEGFGILACTAGIPIRAPATMDKVEKGEEMVAIDGCPVACARKVLEQQGITVGQHIIVTDLGIKKTGELIPSDEEIEKVVDAAWSGS
ncbi:MAG: DGC domain protein [Methanoregulaceae archaeon PtaU1.Bin222]|nr:MAG: DGC domain protein [Methanoregulaceae archaeon PtaU1.Bin222]